MRTLLLLLLALPAQAAFCPLEGEEAARRIVTCSQGVSAAACRKIAESHGCRVVRELPAINAVVITVAKNMAKGVDASLAELDEIEAVEEDKRINWLKSVLPVEEAAKLARGFTPTTSPAQTELPWGVRRVNAAAAWPRTTGKNIKVAVIDTGIDPKHPDLAANVAGGVNVAEPEKSSDFSDDQGHGTHVAGTIAAVRDARGVVGVAPNVRLYGVKVLDSEGNGTYSEIIAGIEWAARNKMDVANMSLGASEGSAALKKAIQAAARSGLVIVAAAGNDSGGPVSYPAAYPETLCVSSSDKNDGLSEFSSVGDAVDFIAPGSDIPSTVPGGYAAHSGTSMAAPHVAGLAALAISQGARGVLGVKAALEAASTRLPGLTSPEQGAGLTDAGKLGGSLMIAGANAK